MYKHNSYTWIDRDYRVETGTIDAKELISQEVSRQIGKFFKFDFDCVYAPRTGIKQYRSFLRPDDFIQEWHYWCSSNWHHLNEDEREGAWVVEQLIREEVFHSDNPVWVVI